MIILKVIIAYAKESGVQDKRLPNFKKEKWPPQMAIKKKWTKEKEKGLQHESQISINCLMIFAMYSRVLSLVFILLKLNHGSFSLITIGNC